MKLKSHKPKVKAHQHMRVRKAVVTRTRGRKLQQRNARLFQRNPLCVRCEPKGIAEPVTQWDHKVPLYAGGADTEENLQGLCDPCHVEKTNEDRITYGYQR